MNSLRKYSISTSHGTIHTLERGSGTPVVFLHGWSVNGFTCLRILETLSKHHRVLVPTIPGFSPSFEWKKKPTPEDFSDALSQWFDAVHISNPIVIGHSLGGVIAIVLTQAREKSIKKLILIDTVGVPGERHSKDWITSWLNKRVNTYKRYGVFDVARYVDKSFLKNAAFRTKDFLYLSTFARHIDIRDYIKNFTLPIMILWGEEDIFTPVSIAYELQKVTPHAEIKTVPGNHDWPVFEPTFLEPYL